MDLTITRFCWSDFGVFGEMMVADQRLYTVERPWLNNQPRISCIPAGEYYCRPRRFNRGGYDAVEVVDVPDRSHILFHRANLATQLAGCIGVNSYLGCLSNQWSGLGSRDAFEIFMGEYGGHNFQLRIVNYAP